jgi:FtsP/CotA-like multicopper oxidase with cupredoxin domain
MSIRILAATALGALLLARSPGPATISAAPIIQPNSNTERAGNLRDGRLTVTLEAKETLWRLDGISGPPMTIEAFAEPGKAPLMPGPLVRAPAGTEIRFAIRNSLAMPLTLLVPARVRGGPGGPAMDSVIVQPGATGVLATHATSPGNYVYRATLPTPMTRGTHLTGLLGGALIVDTAGAHAPNDRVFVMMETPDSLANVCADTTRLNPLAICGDTGRVIYTINGRSWPNTERIHATAGDTLHWRVINASVDLHPMHLHGFYYRVDAFDGPNADVQGRPVPGQMVVTQLLSAFSAMSMTWSPDRPGNWLFHCHFALHLQPLSMAGELDGSAMRDMAGLVIGTNVVERPGARVAGEPVAARRIHLIASEDSETAAERSRSAAPSMHFLIVEHGRRIDAGSGFSPELDLTKGEPVAITVVNHLREPTSVHWHGIEVEDSYVDGVPGFSGTGNHLSPAIAPGDSFVARFTPPRAGTFIYHAHVDEAREQLAGLEGALIVRDPHTDSSSDDHTFFLTSSRLQESLATSPEINGQQRPDTVVLHVGRRARLRLINLSTRHTTAAATFRLEAVSAPSTADDHAEPLRWQLVAKDGADLPATAREPRPAQQMVAMGETYDFELTPERAGMLRLEVLSTAQRGRGKPLLAVPIRVK